MSEPMTDSGHTPDETDGRVSEAEAANLRGIDEGTLLHSRVAVIAYPEIGTYGYPQSDGSIWWDYLPVLARREAS